MLTLERLIANRRPVLFMRTFLFAGSFDPPANHHRKIIERLAAERAFLLEKEPEIPIEIRIWPVGPYSSKQQIASPDQRKIMVHYAFRDIDGVVFDWRDLKRQGGFTSNMRMQADLSLLPRPELAALYFTPNDAPRVLRDIYHVVGADNVPEIMDWNEGYDLWHNAQFIVTRRRGFTIDKLPPHATVFDVEFSGSCTEIRQLISEGKPWEHTVHPKVAEHIRINRLYGFKP